MKVPWHLKKLVKRLKLQQLDPSEAERQQELVRWRADQGDKTHRLEYDLDDSAVVLDVGGYEGQWASDIFAKYCCSVLIFEPVQRFADNIARRFVRNPHITVHKIGLAGANRHESMAVERDSSSIYRTGQQTEIIELRSARELFSEFGLETIDLIKINIEGGEYELLEHLIESGAIKKIRDIQVQFHKFVPHAHQRMNAIQQQLSQTHELTFQYTFVWENWRRKPFAEFSVQDTSQ